MFCQSFVGWWSGEVGRGSFMFFVHSMVYGFRGGGGRKATRVCGGDLGDFVAFYRDDAVPFEGVAPRLLGNFRTCLERGRED